MTASIPPQRFGTDFVEEMRQKHAGRHVRERPLTYDIAVDEQFAPWRAWMNEQLALLSPVKADLIASRIWHERHHWPCIFELATGAALRSAGFRAEYDYKWEDLTPDWTILSPDGEPLCIVEVHTDQPDPKAYAQVRIWRDLATRLGTIPCPVVLFMGADSSPNPPSPRTAKLITADVHAALLSEPMQTRIESHGYTILVAADRRAPGTLKRSRDGERADFVQPTPIGGRITALNLAERIGDKVKKYARLANHNDVPLVIAVGAHRFTGVDLAALDRLIEGDTTISIQFSPGDYNITQSIEINPDNPPRWNMPPGLAGILWISNEFPFTATGRPNTSALRSMPSTLAAMS